MKTTRQEQRRLVHRATRAVRVLNTLIARESADKARVWRATGRVVCRVADLRACIG